MILTRPELETIIDKGLGALKNQRNISVTSLVSGASCGKTTLIKAFRLAIEYVRGFVVADMSEIMDWHQKLENNSPLRDSFIEAEKTRNAGGLVDDHLIFAGFVHYLTYQQSISEIGEVRKVLISGMPRKSVQAALLMKHFPSFVLAYIDCPQEISNEWRLERIKNGVNRRDDAEPRFLYRWECFNQETKPAIDELAGSLPKGQFALIHYQKSPVRKALLLLAAMGLSVSEHTSLHRQISNEECRAFKHLDAVLNPEKYANKHSLSHPHNNGHNAVITVTA